MFYNLILIATVTVLVWWFIDIIKSFFSTLNVELNDPDEKMPWWAIIVYLTIVLSAWYGFYLLLKWAVRCLFTFQCF